jgi:hypothetical protein
MATESEYKQRDALDYVRVTVAAGSNVQVGRFPLDQTHAQKIADPPLGNRRFLLLRNDGEDGTGSTVIYVGGSDVTDQNGYPLVDNQSGASYKAQRLLLDVSDGLTVYGFKGNPIETVRTLELA